MRDHHAGWSRRGGGMKRKPVITAEARSGWSGRGQREEWEPKMGSVV